MAFQPTGSSGYFEGGLAKMVLTQQSVVVKMFPLLGVAENRWSFIAKENKGQRLKYHSVSHVS